MRRFGSRQILCRTVWSVVEGGADGGRSRCSRLVPKTKQETADMQAANFKQQVLNSGFFFSVPNQYYAGGQSILALAPLSAADSDLKSCDTRLCNVSCKTCKLGREAASIVKSHVRPLTWPCLMQPFTIRG